MTDHATLLREAAAAVRPMIEDDIDKREIYAAWRKRFSDAGLDWMAFKSLQKARVEDDRDESGEGKRVAKIMDRLDCTAAYAEMLGYGAAKMNENNCFSTSYSEAKGREYPNDFDLSDNESREMRGFVAGLTDEQKAAALAYDGEDSPVGEITDNQDQIGGNGPDLPVEASTEKQAAGTSRPTNSNSPADILPSEANSAGEAPSSSPASPAALSDDLPISTTPSFAARPTGEFPDIPAFLDRRQPKAREWEGA